MTYERSYSLIERKKIHKISFKELYKHFLKRKLFKEYINNEEDFSNNIRLYKSNSYNIKIENLNGEVLCRNINLRFLSGEIDFYIDKNENLNSGKYFNKGLIYHLTPSSKCFYFLDNKFLYIDFDLMFGNSFFPIHLINAWE